MERVDCQLCEALNASNDLNIDCDVFDDSLTNASCPLLTACPDSMQLRFKAGADTGGGSSATAIDWGWTGLGHYGDIPGGFPLSFDLTCPGTAPTCGSCNVDTVDTAANSNALRCVNNSRTPCTNAFGSDVACGGDTCAVFAWAPQHLPLGGVSVCAQSWLANDPTGSADPSSGDTEIDLALQTRLFGGGFTTQPCPVCAADVTANDGLQNGTCQGGSADGSACDAHGTDTGLGATSLDCPPSPLAGLTGLGVLHEITATTGTAAPLTATVPCDAPANGLDCPCAVCSGDTTQACSTDADCTGFGTCSSIGSGAPREPNDCAAYDCQADPGDSSKGLCQVPPNTDGYCDGYLTAAGRGVVACNSESDCIGFGPEAGSCALDQPRSCFLNPITGSGIASRSQPVLSGSGCSVPTTNGAMNSILGLPGPFRATLAAKRSFTP